ncbi:Chain length determinant protein [Algoriphagus faecimaris]|uniref:Chain length determinant protein n=1 Tax=Algoriphagus faecimaris TaxID=686796 RepID=A0A1G6PW95_9BACT|nr:Wzz/FepE/Etk N-terminal domain-containing protein [Algoriphagus faecimaris]SDC84393.1 Chain length determinant protein [Algoriphagus faecimaris]
MTSQKTKQILERNQFSFINLLRLLRFRLYLLLITISIVLIFGLGFYAASPNSYQLNTVLLVESNVQSGNSGGLGALAQMSGVNIGSANSDQAFLDPKLYPVIVQSKPFLKELMFTKVKSEIYPDSLSLFKYLVETKPENEIIKFLKSPLSILKGTPQIDESLLNEDSIRGKYAPLELYAMGQIGKRISITTEGNLLTLGTDMPEAELSYQFSKMVRELLEKYTSRYVLEKQSNQVSYLEGQNAIAEQNYRVAQNLLTRFKEQNQGVVLESLRAREQNLSAESNLKFDLFRTISQELELAKIKLNSLRPIFSEIEPPYILNRPTAPKLPLTIAFSIIFGFFLGLAVIFLSYMRQYFQIHKSN